MTETKVYSPVAVFIYAFDYALGQEAAQILGKQILEIEYPKDYLAPRLNQRLYAVAMWMPYFKEDEPAYDQYTLLIPEFGLEDFISEFALMGVFFDMTGCYVLSNAIEELKDEKLDFNFFILWNESGLRNEVSEMFSDIFRAHQSGIRPNLEGAMNYLKVVQELINEEKRV